MWQNSPHLHSSSQSPMHLRNLSFVAVLIFLIATSTGLAQWRADLGVFRVGLVAGGDIADSVARLEPIRLALEEALSVPVEIFPARSYPAVISAVIGSRVDYAVLSATAYAAAWNLCDCIEPLVVARSNDGSSGYRQVVITRRGGPASIDKLRGRSLGVFGGSEIGGAMLALHELEQQGLPLADKGGEGGAVTLRRFASGEAAVKAFNDGEIESLLGWQSDRGQSAEGRGTIAGLAARGMDPEQLQVIWRSSLVPHRLHAVRRTLDNEAKGLLRRLMIGLYDADPVAYDSLEPVFGGGFVAADALQFSHLAQMLAGRGVTATPFSDEGADEDENGADQK
jgi:phosphonate transport system substrate-binding protein